MIQGEHLTAAYGKDSPPALRDVTFSVKEGERVALLGANGAGKSTLLLSIAGALLPAGGSLSVGGVPVTKERLPEIRRLGGFLFQNPDDQLFMPTVRDDIAFGPRNFGMDEGTLSKRMDSLGETLHLSHLLGRPVYHLSGGEKRLAALAGVLIMEPAVLLLDEPLAFLDGASRRRLIAVLDSLPQTMLIATHDLGLARTLCTGVIILQEGRIAAAGPTGPLLDDPSLLEQWGL
ncbi:MAG: energy-coupling factor ABC transporter ATP-binding protein [Spirochaetaceae bacterium]|jgi:cobalt/nickel transport system ATP-binding protein|nr:energy-coupling factor ABC transporter ATP-binding protein [Spirochaetaceae bacterium]